MTLLTDPREWARHHFADAQLGDPRRTRRLIDTAAGLANHPQACLPQAFDWDALRAVYRLCNRPEATHQAVLAPHCRNTLGDMARQPLVLALHDDTELDFSSHKALQDVGRIGDGQGRGFLQHNVLAVTPDGQTLGLAHQSLSHRIFAPPGETRRQAERRRRLTHLWAEGIEALGRPPEGGCWVDVGDRGADAYEIMVASRRAGHDFLFRICRDRLVQPGHDPQPAPRKEEVYLRRYARTLAGKARDVVHIPARGGRPARTARVRLADAPVTVRPPQNAPQHKEGPRLRVWLIRVWEDEPPGGVEALEWVLLCSLPTRSRRELLQRRDWYACRPTVEDYHKVEKSGCGQEEARLRTFGRLQPLLALLSVVAVRVLQLRRALASAPEEPAVQAGTAAEVEAVGRLSGREGSSLTVREFVVEVAKLGGFLGRRGDGPPGWQTLWRGYQRLQDILWGQELGRQDKHPPR